MNTELAKEWYLEECHECQAKIGDLHIRGCFQEDCHQCGRQLVGCLCGKRLKNIDRLPYDGYGVLTEACIKYNFTLGIPPNSNKTYLDIHRTIMACVWDKALKKWIRQPKLDRIYVAAVKEAHALTMAQNQSAAVG